MMSSLTTAMKLRLLLLTRKTSQNECPPPSDSEEFFEDDPHGVDQGVGAIVSVETDFKDAIPDDGIQEIMNSVFSPSKQISCLGAAAKVHENTKGRHLLSGSNVLFEFCCDNDSNLGKVGEEEGVRVVRLSREMIYLSDDQAIQQLCEQVDALPGCCFNLAKTEHEEASQTV